MHGHLIPQAQLRRLPIAHEAPRKQAPRRIIVQLQKAVQTLSVLPRVHHPAHVRAVMLDLHGLAHNRTGLRQIRYIALAQQQPGVRVLLSVRIHRAPDHHVMCALTTVRPRARRARNRYYISQRAFAAHTNLSWCVDFNANA